MIVLSNSLEQTLAVGESIVFDKVLIHSGCGECHRENTSSVKMIHKGDYHIEFHGNIGATTETTPAQLTISVGGEALPETTMISVSTAAGDINNVGSATIVKNCCCDYSRITVTNNGTVPVNIDANSALVIYRICCEGV